MESDRHSRSASTTGVRFAGAAVAYAVAGAVHLVTAGLFLTGLRLTVLGFRTFFQPWIGLLLLSMALAMRPRPGRLDPDAPTLREADAPALFAVLHRAADMAGVRRVDTVQCTADFSVSVVRYGLRRRRCFVLGLPLWAVASPQQRVAAVTQALGRSAPRNVRDGTFVGMALRSLRAGSHAVQEGEPSATPLRINAVALGAAAVADGTRRFDARSRKSEWLLWIPRTVLAATARLLLWLTEPAARRALFEADDAAARAASSQAALAALRDRRLARAISVEMHRLAIEKRTIVKAHHPAAPQDDLWDMVHAHAARLRAQDMPQPSGPDAPSGGPGSTGNDSYALRIERLGRAPQCPAAITLDGPDLARVQEELRVPRQTVAQQVLRDGVQL
ncbi:M48 family metallopeptidase [Streptomyces sp. NPDC050256]|uniref:M48 family metallopeptidase n=1 Tax=unclassified Streptomyces TaxID=2593676 RepID=UPI0037B02ECF